MGLSLFLCSFLSLLLLIPFSCSPTPDGDHFTGSLPSQLFNASSLHSLILYDNNSTGSLPPGLCWPPHLQNLGLSHNDLGDPLSPDISQFHSASNSSN
ncbi:hypothetical protein AMTRI_Chr07g81010 [Amborella trichopoda]